MYIFFLDLEREKLRFFFSSHLSFIIYSVVRNGAGLYFTGRYDAFITNCTFEDLCGVRLGTTYTSVYGAGAGLEGGGGEVVGDGGGGNNSDCGKVVSNNNNSDGGNNNDGCKVVGDDGNSDGCKEVSDGSCNNNKNRMVH
jgi:hypothetical protein